MATKTQWTIAINSKGEFPNTSWAFLLDELKRWGVDADQYTINDSNKSIVTQQPGVVDVATESFIRRPDWIVITEERIPR